MAVLDLNKLFPEGDDGSRSPLPKQKMMLDLALDPNGPQFIAYYGGYGSGKSLILCIINIIWGVLHGGEYVIARAFMPELRRTTYQVFKEILPKELLIEERVADAQFRIKSQHGEAKFHFVGLDEPGKLDSLNLSGVSIDEASQTSEEAMLKLQGRLRNKKGLRKMMLVGNPKGHDFVYKYFIKQDCFNPVHNPATGKILSVAEQKKNYRMVIAPSTENKHLPPNYVAQMLATYSAERVQRDIMGSFDMFEGMIFTEFRRDVHVIKPFRIPDEWTRIIGCDHGFTNPAAWIYGAVDYDNNLYIFREYYKSEQLIEDICRENLEMLGGYPEKQQYREKIDSAWFDPSITAKRNERNGVKYSDQDIYIENLPKFFPMQLANNDVNPGIDKIKSYLRLNEKTGKPRLYVFDTCTNLIDEISQYQWEELSSQAQGRSNEKEKPRKHKDHAVDALRYLIMSRPDAPKVADVTTKRRNEYGMSGSLQRELNEIKHGGAPKDPWGEEYGKDSGFRDDF